MAADKRPGRARRWAAQHHPAVWWLTLLNLTLGLVFTILVPPFRGPDEREQVDMIIRSQLGYLDPSELAPTTDQVLGVTPLAGPPRSSVLGYRPPMPVADAVPRRDRPTFDELAAQVREQPGPRPKGTNQLSQHPPLHYVGVGASARVLAMFTPAEAWSWDREVWLYRLHSVALVAALPLLASAAALILGADRTSAAVAACFMLVNPMHTFIGSVVNNDATVMLAGSMAAVGAVAHLRDRTTASALLAAGAGAAAALSKSTGVAILPWVGIVVALVARRLWQEGQRRDAVRNLLMAGTLCVIGVLWHLTNLVRFRDPQPSGVGRRVAEDPDTSLVRFATTWFDRVGGTFWGRPATRTGVVLDSWVTGSLTVATVLLVAAAIWKGRRHAGVVLLALLCVAQMALMLRTNLASYLRSGQYLAFQGRYLFSLLVPLGALVAYAVAEWLRPEWRRWGLVVGAGLGTVLHAVLSWSMLVGYWGGASFGARMESLLAWSPLPHAASLAVLATPVLVLIAWAATATAPRLRRA